MHLEGRSNTRQRRWSWSRAFERNGTYHAERTAWRVPARQPTARAG